ncbi:hypothetical protein ACFXKJ_41885, partial [Kitasatospora indigofera]|uniref:hypothetical protein n=1 Tax=Kitasatospora indigofera TaxID=67307 RepID=UPI0036CC6384
MDGLALDESPYSRAGEHVPGVRFGQLLADLARVDVFAPTGAVDWSSVDRPSEDADIPQGGMLPLQPGPRGDSRWVRYSPRSLEATPWPNFEYAESRLAKLTSSASARLFGQATELVEELIGARLSLGKGMSGVVRETIVRVAQVLRWRGPAEADRLALELIASSGSALAPTYITIEVPVGGDAATAVTNWLAAGQPTPVVLRPQAGPGQVVVQFPAGAAAELQQESQPGTLIVPDLEHFTVLSTGEWASSGVPLVRLLDAPPRYEALSGVPDGPAESLYAKAHGIVRKYGQLPSSDSAPSARKRRKIQERVHEDVAQALVMLGQEQ